MDWLAREPARREPRPTRLWPGARTAIVCGLNYGPSSDPLPELVGGDRGYLSVYARHRDYHDVLKGRLKELAGWIAARFGCRGQGVRRHRAGAGKAAGAAAGLGWQGKHTNLVSRGYGSWLFLGAILTDLDCRPTRRRRTIAARCRALPRRLPDRRLSRRPTGSMRGAASAT